jgi:hypothetical protein
MLRLWKFNVDTKELDASLDLRIFTKSQCPPYIALSYVWGSYDSSKIVHVNGKPLSITDNLHGLLRALAKTGKHAGQWFWTDQISLNQLDIAERDHQVALMGDIYADAATVIAYLGGPPNPTLSSDAITGLQTGSSNTPSDDVLLASFDMLTRSYWYRLWIVQELRLARKIEYWCGDLCIDREILWMLALYLKMRHSHYNVYGHPVLGPRARADTIRAQAQPVGARYYDTAMSLLLEPTGPILGKQKHVLGDFSYKLCKDPRDKVFGLQALVIPSDHIVVDYSQTLEHVLYVVIAHFLEPSQMPLVEPRTYKKAWRSWSSEFGFKLEGLPEILATFEDWTSISAKVGKAMIWASLVLKATRMLGRCHITWAIWTALWDDVYRHAQTPKQIFFASELRKLAKQHLRKLEQLKLEECPVALNPPDYWSLRAGETEINAMCPQCEDFAVEARYMLRKMAEIYGFVVFDHYLYHPDEWPFPGLDVPVISLELV